MANVPDRLYVGKGDIELYNKLQQEWILRGKSRKEQFMLALAFGFKNGVSDEIDQPKEFFRREYLRTEDEALLYAVAIKAKGELDLLSDLEAVFKIAQEYAHAGIRLLADEIAGTSFGSFEKKFEKSLFEIFEELTKSSDTETAPSDPSGASSGS